MRTSSGPGSAEVGVWATSGKGDEMFPGESCFEESFLPFASIMEQYWSMGVVYELRCLVHARQQHGQRIDGMVLARTAGISLGCNPLCMGQAWVLE